MGVRSLSIRVVPRQGNSWTRANRGMEGRVPRHGSPVVAQGEGAPRPHCGVSEALARSSATPDFAGAPFVHFEAARLGGWEAAFCGFEAAEDGARLTLERKRTGRRDVEELGSLGCRCAAA